MHKLKKNTLHKTFDLTVKTAIIIFALGFIFKEIFYKNDFQSISQNLRELSFSKGYLNLILVFVLMVFNWTIEAFKWKYLISKIENITFSQAIKAVFAGTTFSIFTPNRIGEFGGKVFFVKKANHWNTFLITIIGSIAQLLITINFGLIGLLYYIFNFTKLVSTVNSYVYYLLIIITFIFVFTTIFLNTFLLKTFLDRIKPFKKFNKYYKIFSYYKSRELLNVLLLSLFRYLIFSFQFLILLKFFNVNVSIFSGIMMISLIYFAIAAIPTMFLTEIGVRSSVSLFFIGLISTNNIGIVAASFSIWVINLAIPALIGSLFVYNLKFFNNKNHK